MIRGKPKQKYMADLEQKIEHLINLHSLEQYSDTPDFVLAQYVRRCLENFNVTMQMRDDWRLYGEGEGK